MYNVKKVSGVVLSIVIVGIIYHKEAFSHGAKRFIPIPAAEGRGITAKVRLQTGTAAYTGLPLQLRSSFLLHLGLHRHIFALLSRDPGRRSSILLDLVHCRYWTDHRCIELRWTLFALRDPVLDLPFAQALIWLCTAI